MRIDPYQRQAEDAGSSLRKNGVKNVRVARRACPFYPHKRTFAVHHRLRGTLLIVYEICLFDDAIRAHGPTDMPIWGQRYRLQSHNVNPNFDPEAFARVKILFLTEYIYRLQAQ